MTKIVTIINEEFTITEKIEEILNLNENTIVSLDYYSHKQLKEKNIKHSVSDDFFDEIYKKDVDDAVIKIATTWFENNKIKNKITIDDINFGWLIVQEFYSSLLFHLRNFAILLKIKEKIKPEILFVPNNFIIICKDLFPNSDVRGLENEKKDVQEFVFDVFAIKYNLGPFPIVIKLPRRFFFTLRKYYEQIVIPIFNSLFSSFEKNKDTVMLVDFNPVNSESLLNAQSKNKKMNTFLLNRRRIALWNFKAFNILKKNRSRLVSYEQYLNKEDRIKIKKKIKKVEKDLDDLFLDESIFSEIFSFKDHSFWKLIDNIFKKFCRSRVQEAIYEMVGVEKMFSYVMPKLIIHFYEVALQEKILVWYARKKNIPTCLMQHATYYLSFPDYPKHNPILGIIPLYKDKKIITWGNSVKEYAIENGIKKENIILGGSIRHDPFFHAKKISPSSNETKTILIILGGLDQRNIDGQSIATYENYEKSLKIIFETLKKIPNINKVVKLHPANMSWKTIRVEPIIRAIDSSVKIIVDGDLIKLIQSSYIVISIGITTVLMESNILEKPTLTLIADNQDFMSVLSSGYTVRYSPEESSKFKKHLIEILTNKSIYDESVKKGIEFVDDYLVNHGTASEYLANFISKY